MTDPTLAVQAGRIDDLTPRTLYAILRLRVDVFVVEQKCAYPEMDGRDTEPATLHLWVEEHGRVLSYLRLLEDGPGLPARIGRVCTAADARGRGLSATLLREALDRIGERPAVLGAQSYLRDWYARFGFAPAGEEYLEDGIWHTPMARPAP